MDSAALLRRRDDNGAPDDILVWELRYGSQGPLTYIDSDNVVGKVRNWAEGTMAAAEDFRRARSPPSLLISGLVKVRYSVLDDRHLPVRFDSPA